jgi:hypothetical protein
VNENRERFEHENIKYCYGLNDCPFCGRGEFQVRENGKIWLGMKYSEPVSWSVMHWCNESPGISQPLIERKGKTLADAVAKWNERK